LAFSATVAASPAARAVTPLYRCLALARAAGIPAFAVASAARLAPSTLSEYAAGKASPSQEAAHRIAQALGVDVHNLFPGQ
jgi:transcriptional regulator with XRE-family HTH domain